MRVKSGQMSIAFGVGTSLCLIFLMLRVDGAFAILLRKLVDC